MLKVPKRILEKNFWVNKLWINKSMIIMLIVSHWRRVTYTLNCSSSKMIYIVAKYGALIATIVCYICRWLMQCSWIFEPVTDIYMYGRDHINIPLVFLKNRNGSLLEEIFSCIITEIMIINIRESWIAWCCHSDPRIKGLISTTYAYFHIITFLRNWKTRAS